MAPSSQTVEPPGNPGRFIAVEALAEQWNRSEVELALINRLMDAIAKAGLSQEQSAALLRGVGQLKRVSISHACRTYLT
jgi:hypothetical protein